jgi:hypothetical protein
VPRGQGGYRPAAAPPSGNGVNRGGQGNAGNGGGSSHSASNGDSQWGNRH